MKGEKEMEAKTKAIEFEEVTIKIPKAIMDLLRDAREAIELTPQQFFEYFIVEQVRSLIDYEDYFSPTPEQMTKKYNLNPVFKEILDYPSKDC